MTFIVVPHAGARELTTRTYEVPYRTLRRWVIVAGVVATALLAMVVSWGYLAARAAQVAVLERDVQRLETQVRQVEQLRQLLTRLEARNQQITNMLGGARADSVRRGAGGDGTAAREE